MRAEKLNRANGEVFETEISILPDGAVVILDLDEKMLDLALALDPQNYRLKQRRRLVKRKAGGGNAAKQNRRGT